MEEDTRFRYHYCARWWLPALQREMYVDGIVLLVDQVKTMTDYRALKLLISPENADKMTILSLTPLPSGS